VPFSGIWHADVQLDRSVGTVAGPQVLELAGSQWSCAPVRFGDYAGTRRVRLVGGTGGWRTSVPSALLPSPFTSPLGVPISVVLATASTIAGELPPSLVGYPGSPLLGPAYVFKSGPMSLVLQDVLGDAWWMDPTGVVQTAPRAPTPIVSEWSAVAYDGACGELHVATDAPGDWMPGATFIGPVASGTVSRVAHELTGDTLRTKAILT
jgi:hypothetical protein